MTLELRAHIATLRLPFDSARTLYEGTSEVRLYRNGITDVLQIGKRVSAVGAESAVVFREAQLLQSIRHPSIVPVHDVAVVQEPGMDPLLKIIEMIMPYYPEGSIFDALTQGKVFSIGQSVRLVRETLSGLGELQEAHGLLHRDIKSANVFVDDGHARVGDLGLAIPMHSDGSAEAFANVQMYTAPETCTVNRVTRATDIYGVGLMLHELLNGPLPYDAYDREMLSARLDHGKRGIRTKDLRFCAHVPTRLRQVVTKAISLDPRDRYQTCRSMLDVLDRAPFIDWVQIDQSRWEGTNPTNAAVRYRVEGRKMIRSGKWRLSGLRRVGSWVRCVEDQDVTSLDSRSAHQFFDQLVKQETTR